MRQLMRRIKEYKHLEDDRLQNKGKAPLLWRSRQGIMSARLKKDFRMQEPEVQIEGVNMAFKEPVHKILDRIKNESFFRDKGHTTEQCRVLKDHLGQLVKAGYLKEFVMDSADREAGQGAQQKRNPLPPPLGVIEVIHAAPRGTTTAKGVMTVACLEGEPPKKRMKVGRLTISFSEEDLEGTIQPYDDALAVDSCNEGRSVTLHVKVKFPTEYGVAVVRGNQRVARQCFVAAVRWKSEQLEQAEETEKETL
ncbi:uncharacterized protein LOC115990300 [Quercus lobata]|uniref:uncharacterized protein LOC115990300 n=1 Tax=Quercus lobata TaxID=97700 RepID=UPI0012494804|nr:uncharacterized protein LOC115990300 [Quercus lobata]